MARYTSRLFSPVVSADRSTRELILLEFLEAEERNIVPRPSRLGQRLNLTRSAIGDQLALLVNHDPPLLARKRRGEYELTDDGRRHAEGIRPRTEPSYELPYYGLIAAGEPKLMSPDPIDSMNLHVSDAQDHFVMRVSGDSMTHEHIADGDLVVLRRVSGWDGWDNVRRGDIIAAAVPEGANVHLPDWLTRLARDVESGLLVSNLELNYVTLKRLDTDMTTLIGSYGIIRTVFKPVGVVVQVIRSYERREAGRGRSRT
jgi:SOS-response transcriptional repressor LexA